jgi:hypothetical protein
MRLDSALGGHAREPEQTLREVGRQLDTAVVFTRSELAAALDCLERECYAIARPDSGEVAMAVDVFDRLHASLTSASSSSGVLRPV